MIRYRPNLKTVSLSLKEELIFDSMEEMKDHILDRWQRISAFLGAREPISREDILIGEAEKEILPTGWQTIREVYITRMTDVIYDRPKCIGFCGE